MPIALLDYYPELITDSDKFIIPFTSLGIENTTTSICYFALLYQAFGYYYQELRISQAQNNLALLIGDIPLISIKNILSVNEYTSKLLNPYTTFTENFGIKLIFKLLTNQVVFQQSLNTVFSINQLISWNSSAVLIYHLPGYYSNWNTINGKDILCYLLHIGLTFRSDQTFTITYETLPVSKLENGIFVNYTEYSFYVTFKLAIPTEFNTFTAMDVT